MDLYQYIKLNWNSSRNEVQNTERPKSQLTQNILSYKRGCKGKVIPVQAVEALRVVRG
jgi:hypothetical protein